MSGRLLSFVISILLLLWAAPVGLAQSASDFDELVALRDSAKIKEAPVFAPKTWEKAQKKFEEADQAIRQRKKQKTIDEKTAEAREYTENAIKAAEVTKVTLQAYLAPRAKAIEAQAVILVAELYQKAEIQFMKATAKVESGNVKSGLKEAEKAGPMFDLAELEAIREDILGQADRLIEKALVDDAEKFAASTLNKAMTARTQSNSIITADRYNREEAIAEAARAEYEARHASNIGLSVRSLNRNDQAWEKLMLGYEIQMNRVGETIDLEHLPFDHGPLAAADTLINYIKALQADNEQLTSQMRSLTSDLTAQIETSLSRIAEIPSEDNPVKLAEALDAGIVRLLADRDGLAEQLSASRAELTSLSEEHQELSGELSGRVEREEKFRNAKTMLNPSEGEVLFNSSNDIVLRLTGLSFDIGRSDIQDDHVALLEKVEEVIKMFPEAQLVVEGHTDASGDASSNETLSEKRAFAVMQYLRQSLLLPANKIQSMGYGADRPVASNQTADGRAKNRRIDIIVMQ
jgi:outer membrane protein OmpA-like peptidoglycan-associated protein